MWINTKKQKINWITVNKHDGDEWKRLRKKFVLDKAVKSAIIRFETDCTCGVYVNDEFITAGTGRQPERVNCYEITSKMIIGENTLMLVLGSAYFQKIGRELKEQRGYWFSSVAFELCIEFIDGEKMIIASDDSWEALGTNSQVNEIMQVTDSEYGRFWRNAAVWKETGSEYDIPAAVTEVVGNEYVEYANKSENNLLYPKTVCKSNLSESSNHFLEMEGLEYNDVCDFDVNNPEQSFVIFDFGRIVVGHVEIEYDTDKDTDISLYFDTNENLQDFNKTDSECLVQKLCVNALLKSSENTWFNLRRRAFRYLKINFKDDQSKLHIKNITVKPILFPAQQKGWFNCSDNTLNKAWEVGRYTLQINKHQEYESCPHNEMQFFSGDGAIDALIDYYAFGEGEVLKASLSLRFDEKSAGIATSKFDKNSKLWEYYGWRIISVFNHYKYFGDLEFIKCNYDDCVKSLEWLIERMNDRNLLFQIPAYSYYRYTPMILEYTCSTERLGEKSFLNCIFYKSLKCMSDMAGLMNDEAKKAEWADLADKVKKAINRYLWSEEKKAYIDALNYDEYIPQDGNALAVLFGVAEGERAELALQTLKEKHWSPYGSALFDVPLSHTRGGNATISPLICTYEAEARFLSGAEQDAIELIRRCWGTMLEKGAETFWEFAPNNGEERWPVPSHAWSAGCTYLLSAYVLGIKPIEPDYKVVEFRPHICDLDWFSGVVPTSKGLIGITYKKHSGDANSINKFTLAIPSDIGLKCNLPENSMIDIKKY